MAAAFYRCCAEWGRYRNWRVPCAKADFPREKILEAIRFDKKFQNREVRFIVTPGIGSARVATDVTMEDIAAAIATL